MKEIGIILKGKREELGMSIDEVSAKTRLTTKYIKAIEEGDMDFFNNDLSYLRFFLKSYCDVVGVDFNEMKAKLDDSIDDYTSTISMKAIQENIEIENNIKKTATRNPNIKSEKVKRKIKIDFSLVSLIAVIAIIVVFVIYAVVVMILPNMGGEETPVPPKVEETPKKEDDTPPVAEEKPVEAKKEVNITKKDEHTYIIENIKEGEELSVETKFGSNSWFGLTIDDVALNEPASKIYNFDETVSFKTPAKDGKKIKIRLGYFAKTTFKVNGKEVPVDDKLKTLANADEITLVVKVG
ncbi:MAG: helix-turn-helix domain-containing protein [Erysipelotrichaceae bacterium]